MKVVDVRTYAVANPSPHGGRSWIFVRLMTGEGIETCGGFHAEILREPIQMGEWLHHSRD